MKVMIIRDMYGKIYIPISLTAALDLSRISHLSRTNPRGAALSWYSSLSNL